MFVPYRKRHTWKKLTLDKTSTVLKKLTSILKAVIPNNKAMLEESDDIDEETVSPSDTKPRVSVLKVLAKTFGLDFAFGLVWTFLHTFQNFINPVFLK